MSRPAKPDCGDCPHKRENLRTDFSPATTEYWCDHPHLAELSPVDRWIGFISKRITNCPKEQ